MRNPNRRNVIVLLIASILTSPFSLVSSIIAQETRKRRTQDDKSEKPQNTWPSEPRSITKNASDIPGPSIVQEPVLRIALSTDTRAATISTTARLLNASELNSSAPPLDTTRLRIESRLLSALRQSSSQNYEVGIARSLSREEAERLADSVHQSVNEDARAGADAADKWRVVIVKQPGEDAEAVSAKLEDAGFEVVTSFKTPMTGGNVSLEGTSKESSSTSNRSANSPCVSKVKLTSRPSAPNRELVAFARGAAPLFHSSAPLTLASSDETNSPVRFNDKPYRGKIEVFANTRGALTVVNVIGLEDYVRGVVPNELSYPALEALKAQAIAARTYALKNRGQFASEGFDLLPTTRSQVYRGLTSETSLTSRAVDETRGLIATYNGEPINALYTSTCGGRTEDSENIFNEAVPYLRGRECAAEVKTRFAPFTIKSSRELFEIKEERDLVFARDAALLSVNGFALPADKISSSWLSTHVSDSEAREWLNATARLARNVSFRAPEEVTKPPKFATALVAAVFGEGRADTLLNSADVDYLLGFHDGEEIPPPNRADVAMLLRDGALSLFADASLRPKETMSRARVLHAISHLLEARNLLALQKGTTRPASAGLMMLRSTKGKDQPVVVSREAFLFREFGENLYQLKSLALL